MRNKKQLKDILSSLPLNLCFDDIEAIAKKNNLNPIELYLEYNDYVLKQYISDIDISDIDDIDICEIEDLI